MFNLLIGLNDEVVPPGRLLEGTDSNVRERLSSDINTALQRLPALSMPEVGDLRFEQVAKVGTITKLQSAATGHRFRFVPNPNLNPIPISTIQHLGSKLGVDARSWEFTRTHWTVKDADLFEVLLEHQVQLGRGGLGNFRFSGAVQFPIGMPRDPSLVAVMMPFSANFDVVYETIETAVRDAGLYCVRADDIWEDDHVIGDVLSLLWRAQIIVADLTDKNPNVFYEVGLAHALPRRTVLLTQRSSDIPFDLQSIRYLQYGLSTSGRASLQAKLSERLSTMISQTQD